mmetsp:Transcript_9124/g.8992  ORF Transcript_9124/g.8992 Transcript_9124/m.8992 type:complete len:405 (-) Transcript_9124:173-1387(-)|eukprot:CAMPEP_0119045808 /NCGR_PEP_ID=MMETSP1177-20130426/42708_1 /TAXON_ID=2985 /ORGANISM="Ochromonas sp, Strain CCMP1899" /LENGTH=404 /DNA_ID=CAMNT_0007018177 /DNA_START=27 /DNA_END=1241 /DNA_ORIENTATION=+
MESDKMFNLQLTIQKLQEEVTLYRNGTNGAELFELIKEKDTEIEDLKKSAIGSKENLRLIAKRSKELLANFDKLRIENEVLQIEHSDLIQEKKALVIIVEDLKCSVESAERRHLEKNVTIGHLEEELHNMEEGIEKLQARCASLVQENSENKKKIGSERERFATDRSEKNERIKEQMDELGRAMRLNTEAKERANREHANSLDLSSKLQRSVVEFKTVSAAKELLQSENDSIKSQLAELLKTKLQADEVFQTSQGLSATNEGLLQETLGEKELEMSNLNMSIKKLIQNSEDDFKKIFQYENEKEVKACQQKEIDFLKLKNAELDEKIKRQDSYMKSRLLKDKTNVNPNALCTPEPSASCYRPPSARALALSNAPTTAPGPLMLSPPPAQPNVQINNDAKAKAMR